MLTDLLAHGPVVRVILHESGPLALHCMATGAGYERRANETYDWEGSNRAAFAVIQHTIGGRGELDYEGTRHVLRPGDTMVLRFPHANRYWLAPGGSWEYFWIGVHGIEALRVVRAVIDAAGPVLRPAAREVDRLAAACLALTATTTTSGVASAAAYAAVMAVHDAAFENASPAAEGISAPIRRCLGYIEQHLGDHLEIERLARLANLSRAHFVRKFTAEVGTPPSDHVFAARMRLAERLLIATDSSVAEIARAAGFADGNYFAKAFRRASGLTPTAFRAQRQPARHR
ncbi:MAG TPA: AraC family transcriptional regulator [Hypericibacter adhaerens]|uniref:AraC family transcriptional regulator n=1 Tax=Hypericibacter adhaerens TaxID=2602016 RepID=UPI002CFDD1B2|nr:AraC family transcriptional regulator [Hypericibacter adhaerens]HWA45325.1 AraC family transcriptional regulator [Hypericibacter adhaerens]